MKKILQQSSNQYQQSINSLIEYIREMRDIPPVIIERTIREREDCSLM